MSVPVYSLFYSFWIESFINMICMRIAIDAVTNSYDAVNRILVTLIIYRTFINQGQLQSYT